VVVYKADVYRKKKRKIGNYSLVTIPIRYFIVKL